MSLATVVMFVEGVLQKPDGVQALDAGVRLYRALSTSYNLVLVTEQEIKKVKHFLLMNAISGHIDVVPLNGSSIAKGMNSLRRDGYILDFVISPNPAVTSILYEQGFEVLTYTSPRYARPEWRPGVTMEERSEEANTFERMAARVIRETEQAAEDLRMRQVEK